jgi:hypothetical protein
MQRQELESSLIHPTQSQTPAKVLNSSWALRDTEFIIYFYFFGGSLDVFLKAYMRTCKTDYKMVIVNE